MTEVKFVSEPTVELVTHNVSDDLVCTSARVSTGAKKNAARDKGLINALIREKHGVPFEHGSMTFRISVPIFVMRQLVKHRAGWSVSEESGRYRELEPVFYVPGGDRPVVQTGKAMDYELHKDDGLRHDAYHRIRASSVGAYENYQALLAQGVAREVARMVLPLNLMTNSYITVNPRSLMHFLSLRTPDGGTSKPQYEIAQLAYELEQHWAALMPVTHEAFVNNGRMGV